MDQTDISIDVDQIDTSIDLSEIQRDIFQTQIAPSYAREISDGLCGRRIWNKMSVIFTILTFVFMAGSSVTSFSSPQFPSQTYLSYLSGTLTVISMICFKFAIYFSSLSSDCTKQINLMLKSIGMSIVLPDTSMAAIDSSLIKESRSRTNRLNTKHPHGTEIKSNTSDA